MDLPIADDIASDPRRDGRGWMLAALLGSVVVHLALVIVFKLTELPHFSVVPRERLSPRPMSVKQVEIDPKFLEETAQSPDAASPKKTDTLPDIILPDEEPSFDKLLTREIRATPAAADLAKVLAEEQPDPATQTALMAERLNRESARDLESSLVSMNQALSNEQPIIQPGSLMKGTSEDLTKAAAALAAEGGGYSDLDGLLAQAGELRAGTAPILMPTDLLFDYDSSDMRPGAEQSLAKLGTLIAKNPQALFVIEGHTDSFGSPDYNLMLSKARAESVKRTVVALTGVSPSQIQTRGYGSTRLIAPSNGSPEQQQINRRVEIAIKAQ